MIYVPLLLAWAIAVVSPGPDFVAVLRTAASQGRRQGTLVGAGVVCGIACWAILALSGLSLLLARMPGAYRVMRTVGAVFLLAYGLQVLWTVWRARRTRESDAPQVSTDAAPVRSWRSWRLGLATNLANPKAVVFFGALFATVLPPHLGAGARGVVLLVMLAMALSWFTVVAVLAGSGPVMRAYRRVARGVDAVAGGLFTAVGVALIPR